MSLFDEWDWGYCPACRRLIVLGDGGMLVDHAASSFSSAPCAGSLLAPSELPEEKD